MSNNLRMLPGRWFAPRDAAFCVNSPSGMPLRDEIDRIFQGLFNGMVTPWLRIGAPKWWWKWWRRSQVE